MLTPLPDLAYRIGQCAPCAFLPQEITATIQTLEQYYGTLHNPAHLVPRLDEAKLRDSLVQAAPQLEMLALQLRNLLEGDYSALVLPQLGLAHLDQVQLSAVLYGLCLCMGSPTATNKTERKVVWDVKASAARMQAGDVSTFSEHAYEATLHTDTQYYADPERYVLLYFIQPARCGGGISSLRDVNCIKRELARSADGRWALDFLSHHPLPFRIPGTFTSNGQRDTVEITHACIFGDKPKIRFRIDTLEKGLQVCPEYNTVEVQQALAILQAELDRKEMMYQAYMPKDSVVLVNNHEVLHGRSDFTDLERHALRIRIADNDLHLREMQRAVPREEAALTV